MNCHYPFELPPLPYAYDALQPQIDSTTLAFHHDKHFAAYVENLNKALEKYPAFQSWPLERLIVENCRLPFQIQIAVWNNAGGVYNHSLYFTVLGAGKAGGPSGKLQTAIIAAFGSVPGFLSRMKECALAQFGSGYAWLVCGSKGYLRIITTANQDTPFPFRLCPILNLDIWEHAYYLQYQNRRAEYIDRFFEVLDWSRIEENYLACLPGKEKIC